ncbi:MAG: HAD hydrolase-like protein [Planctomycetaceae bacterium]|jgi:phosphoglycolate phosphatase-like HAD superfamily hydrolase|nr:HAD hydrolase-like protein [Planctomycetaceae bacterium]
MQLNYTAQHGFLVGIDSDGCAFDTMELKHKECFVPMTIKHWNLQGVSKYARETFEFVNLYSKSRGVNRFPALIETLERLARRPEVKARNVPIPMPQPLVEWIKRETKLGNPALKEEVERNPDPVLKQTLEWSLAVNRQVDSIVDKGVPPFPGVREALKKMKGSADVLVVSATPQDALVREWAEQDIEKYVAAICGQEIGTKKESLELAGNIGKYGGSKMLMVGDAPGDYKAAAAVGALFFPINPGAEETSWRELGAEGLDRFFNGTFAGAYQQKLLDGFNAYLPSTPPWTET